MTGAGFLVARLDGLPGMTGRRVVLLALAAAALACSGNPDPKRYAFPPTESPAPGTTVEGVASWYGPGYHGKRTSSGERFDQDALTAAHYNWAFGTRVKVTLLSTGRDVVVRVNDRMPGRKRVIDLSRGAARRIGLIGPGTGRVRLEVLGTLVRAQADGVAKGLRNDDLPLATDPVSHTREHNLGQRFDAAAHGDRAGLSAPAGSSRPRRP
jgi:rare lipoprotein A